MNKLKVSFVALPIGNPQDISLRAQRSLIEADRIVCEDSRKIRRLLDDLKISTQARIDPLPGDEERKRDWPAFFEKNSDELRWVLCSDAGTPLVNDPGRNFLEFCQSQSFEIEFVPGPSAPTLAWQMTGGFGLPYSFLGFAPKLTPNQVEKWKSFFSPLWGGGTVAFFDTRHQIKNTFQFLCENSFAEQKAICLREMSKEHEETLLGTVKTLSEELAKRVDAGDALGEMTVLVEAHSEKSAKLDLNWDELVSIRLSKPKEAAKILAKILGLSTSEAYQKLVDMEKVK